MSSLIPFVTVIHVILCVFIVLSVLVQSGKGAEISASFGGSSQTVFGSTGGANFFQIFTGVCAALFMVTSVFLATQGGNRAMTKSVMDISVPASSTGAPATTPAAPAGQGATAPAKTGAANTSTAPNTAAPAAAPATGAAAPAQQAPAQH
jgi:preprotein translocase subunit SecG